MAELRFGLCLAAAFVLAVLAILGAVLGPAMQAGLFERALLATVNREAVQADELQLRAFAQETMAYLRGEKQNWQPKLSIAIPKAFDAHMREVRGWISGAPWAFAFGIALAAALFAAAWGLGGLSRRGCAGGLLLAIGLVLAALLWAAIDFDSLWMALHRWFIPGGIFPAGEPVMQLFPLELFLFYAKPVALAACLHLAVLALCLHALRYIPTKDR
ncbi:MAG: DUF1461 domain-containing protein [Clostridiales bacterium]|nr:DUF1461 domain-containing protein [Clostridiales bacterium]MDO4351110.1 DUF1461 domain-containing protein [Eubacteriales bacterium]MDY4007836.1 DUF1461 domain-containing protein [Candidatus Limiplasma sp.]